jgi:two-component system, LytTR family, sensor kinase
MKPQIRKYIWIALLLIIFTEIAEWNTYAANTGQTDPYSFPEYIFLLLLSCFAYIVTTFSYRFCSRYLKHYSNTVASITAFFAGAAVFYLSYPFYHSAYAAVMQGMPFWNEHWGTLFFWRNGLYILVSIYVPIAIFSLLLLHQQHINDLQLALVEKEKAGQQKELQFLNRQLDHHFLFNNFHFLSNLAEQRDERTVAFTRKMAMLYRYVTKYAKEEVVSLQEELQFARDYLDIMDYRFPGQFHLILHHQTAAPLTTLYVLPGALQLLVENVIKHNEAPKDASLSIGVYINDDVLTVANAIQPKAYRHESLGLGLKHLSDFYTLRWSKQLSIRQEQGLFSVTLPLIQSAV